jgi:hypothetical protein
MKSISLPWSLPAGLLAAAAQGVTFYLRFGRWNTDATFVDYLFFFLAGTLGGSILIFFLNRQTRARGRWIVLIVFLLVTPVALFLMVGGGLLGPLGVLIFPQIPWALFTWLGSLLAGRVSQA